MRAGSCVIRSGCFAFVTTFDTEPHATDVSIEDTEDRLNRFRACRRVVRVAAGDRFENDGRIGDASGHRPDVVERPSELEYSVAADPSPRRLQADDAALRWRCVNAISYHGEAMNLPLTCITILLMPALLSAQEVGQQRAAEAVVEEFTAELHRQERESREARTAVRKTEAYRAASRNGDREVTRALLAEVASPDVVGLGKRALAAADDYPGDDRVRLLVWAALESRDPEIVTTVVDEILEKHLDSAEVTQLLEWAGSISKLLDRDRKEVFLSTVVDGSKNDYVRAWAMYKMASRMGRGAGASEEEKRRRAEIMAEVKELSAGTELGELIDAPRFVAERLQIGMEVPEIVGEDLAGVVFKLSDYRGQVVVLDFWGFW